MKQEIEEVVGKRPAQAEDRKAWRQAGENWRKVPVAYARGSAMISEP
jgi:hypothetical protein